MRSGFASQPSFSEIPPITPSTTRFVADRQRRGCGALGLATGDGGGEGMADMSECSQIRSTPATPCATRQLEAVMTGAPGWDTNGTVR